MPRKRERVAPELTALAGAEAVAILRAGGFTAAIEPAPSDFPEGTVIEQHPRAGVRLDRWAVVTLRLAAQPVEAPRPMNDAGPQPSPEHVEAMSDGEDLERWFAALAPPGGAPRSERCRRRRRKHRPSGSSGAKPFRDPSRTEILPAQDLSSIAPPARGKRYLDIGPLLASALCALPASLAGSHCRRAAALLAALLLFALLGTEFLAAGGRGQSSSDDPVPALTAHAQLASRVGQRAIVRAAPRPAQPAIHTTRVATVTHPRPRAARPSVRIHGAEPPPVEATPARSHELPPAEASQGPSAEPRPVEASPPPPERSPAAAAAAAQTPASSNAQFAYLGQ